MLEFQEEWIYESPGLISKGFLNETEKLISKITSQVLPSREKNVLEDFKYAFNGGSPPLSSSASWAWIDPRIYMSEATDNPALFIKAFYVTISR